MKNTLALIKEKVGHGNVKKFITKELGIKYRTFVYQLHHEIVTYKTIRLIIKKLDIKFDNFQDYEFIPEIEDHSQADREAAESMKQLYIPKPQKLSSILKGK